MWEKLTGWLRFLWEAGRQTEKNTLAIEKLHANDERFLEYAKAPAAENEMLRQMLQHKRELRERDIEILKLELRLRISEELRGLPPAEESKLSRWRSLFDGAPHFTPWKTGR